MTDPYFAGRKPIWTVPGGGELPHVYFDTAVPGDSIGVESQITIDVTDGQTFLVLSAPGSTRPGVGGDATAVLHPEGADDGPFILRITGDGELLISSSEQLAVMPVTTDWFHPSPDT